MSDRLREALERFYDSKRPNVDDEFVIADAARRFLALTETGQRVIVRQNRLGESIIHMEGNPLADAADNLKTGTYLIVDAAVPWLSDYTKEDTID